MRKSNKNIYSKFMGLTTKKKLAVIAAVAALILVLIPLLTYAYFARDIANEERLMNRNNTGVVLLDRHGEEFYRAYNSNISDIERVPLEELPEHVPQALIATEDREFYEHNGYSLRRTVASLYGNVLNLDATRFGGSTITQQLAKNALLSSDKNYFRKYQELALAIAIERHYEKDKILEMYLNSVYFGEGAFGIEDAAQTYFGKSARELSLAESSMLIGLLPSPSAFSPISGDMEAAQNRQEVVLTSMVDTEKITEEEKSDILDQDLAIQSAPEQEEVFAIHFAEMVLEELRDEHGEERIARSGFTVKTTLDANWQQHAEEAVKSHIEGIQYLGAKNGAVVAIDPSNGEVRAVVGSVDWRQEEFGMANMATTPRQPGSSFKPIYYTEALNEEVITPATILKDKPTDFGGGYRPENFDNQYRGDITVRRALANSLNIPSVKVMEKLGVEESVEAAQRMGMDSVDDSADYGLSLALGTAEVKLLNLTNAYAAFANQGEQYEPATIQEVQNKYGKTIFTNIADSEEVMDEGASYLISSILSDDSARAATFGGSLSIGRPAAVKTGTTDDNRDALTVGYTPSIAVGVWVGNNENTPMTSIGGSSGAAPIWRNVVLNIVADQPVEDFERPSSVESVLICKDSGLRAPRSFSGSYKEFFLRGSAPDKKCNAPKPEEDRTQREKPDEDEEDNEEEEEEEEEKEDTEAPSTPPSLEASSVGPNQIDLTWSPSSDNTGVTGYEVYRGGKLVGDVGETSFSDTGLDPDTQYNYQVIAYDEASNESDPATDSAKTDKEEGSGDSGGSNGETSFLEVMSASLAASVRMRI